MKYAVLIAEKNILYETAQDILNFFQNVGKDPNALKNMSMGKTKCRNIISNVSCIRWKTNTSLTSFKIQDSLVLLMKHLMSPMKNGYFSFGTLKLRH